MSELDNLEEIECGQNPSTRPDRRVRVCLHNQAAAAAARAKSKPQWVKQLRAIEGKAAARKLKAKLTK